jgi:hypothetical protein
MALALKLFVFLVAASLALALSQALRRLLLPLPWRGPPHRRLAALVYVAVLLSLAGLAVSQIDALLAGRGRLWVQHLVADHLLLPAGIGILAGVLLRQLLAGLNPPPEAGKGLLAALQAKGGFAMRVAAIGLVPLAGALAVVQSTWLGRVQSVSAGGVQLTLAAATPSEARPQLRVGGDTAGGISEGGFRPQLLVVLQDLTNVGEGSRNGVIERDQAIIRWTEGKVVGAEAAERGMRAAAGDVHILEPLKPAVNCLAAYVRRTGQGRVVALESGSVIAGLAAIDRSLRTARLHLISRPALRDRDNQEGQAYRLLVGAHLTRLTSDVFGFRIVPIIQNMMADMELGSFPEGLGSPEEVAARNADLAQCQEAYAKLTAEPPRVDRAAGDFGGMSPYLTALVAYLYAGIGAPKAGIGELADWIADFQKARQLAARSGDREAVAALPIWLELRALFEMFTVMTEARGQPAAPRATPALMEEIEGRFREFVVFRAATEARFADCLRGDEVALQQRFLLAYSSFLWWYLDTIGAGATPDAPVTMTHLAKARFLRDLDFRCLPNLPHAAVEEQQALNRLAFAKLAVAYAAESQRRGGLDPAARDLIREARKAQAEALDWLQLDHANFRRNLGQDFRSLALESYPRTEVLLSARRVGLEIEALE